MQDGIIIVWDTESMMPRQIIPAHEGQVLCCSVSPDGTKVCTYPSPPLMYKSCRWEAISCAESLTTQSYPTIVGHYLSAWRSML
jgi:WD40 repeat protein